MDPLGGRGKSIKDGACKCEREAFYTALGPGPLKGPGQFVILYALWCNLRPIPGTMNDTEHKAFKYVKYSRTFWVNSIFRC